MCVCACMHACVRMYSYLLFIQELTTKPKSTLVDKLAAKKKKNTAVILSILVSAFPILRKVSYRHTSVYLICQ